MTHARKINGTVLLIGVRKDNGRVEVITQSDKLSDLLPLTLPEAVDTKKYLTVAPVKIKLARPTKTYEHKEVKRKNEE